MGETGPGGHLGQVGRGGELCLCLCAFACACLYVCMFVCVHVCSCGCFAGRIIGGGLAVETHLKEQLCLAQPRLRAAARRRNGAAHVVRGGRVASLALALLHLRRSVAVLAIDSQRRRARGCHGVVRMKHRHGVAVESSCAKEYGVNGETTVQGQQRKTR